MTLAFIKIIKTFLIIIIRFSLDNIASGYCLVQVGRKIEPNRISNQPFWSGFGLIYMLFGSVYNSEKYNKILFWFCQFN